MWPIGGGGGGSTTYHEARDDAVEHAALEAEAFGMERKLLEVFSCLGDGGPEKADLNTARRRATNAHVEEHDVRHLRAGLGDRCRHERGHR